MLLLITPLFLVTAAPAQEKENPIEKEVKENLKDPTKPFVMFVRLKLKDGNAAKFEAAFATARSGDSGKVILDWTDPGRMASVPAS
jgi:hypothetical protein